MLKLHFRDSDEVLCASFNPLETEPSVVAEEIVTVIGSRGLKLFEYLAGFLPVSFIKHIPWASLDCDQILIQFAGLPNKVKRDLTRLLRQSNYIAVKGGDYETGTDVIFSRNTTHVVRLKNYLSHARFRLGRLVVGLRNQMASSAMWLSRKERLIRYLSPGSPRSIVMDKAFGVLDPPFHPLESQAAALIVESMALTEWSLELPVDEGIEGIARQCHRRHGVYPISFCFPETSESLQRIKEFPAQRLSQVIPGQPYTFDNPIEYLHQYSDSYLAITHRKAGWDCFRHVEIMAGGAVPLMLDSNMIPEFSMIHYPKRAFNQVRAKVLTSGGLPDFETRKKFNDHYRRHLTTESMVRYMFTMSGIRSAKRVLFIDTHLAAMVDYQSVLTLIGLKQVFGRRCEVLCPVDYIYESWHGEAKLLYGRGFGYTRVISDDLRSENEAASVNGMHCEHPHEWNLDMYDAVIFGNIFLDIDLAESVLGLFPPEKTMWILGSDNPPNWREARRLAVSGTNVFVRAINS